MCYPRPAHHIRLIVGGGGEARTLRIAAEHADAINLIGGIDVVARKLPVLHRHCVDVGRDPAEVDVTVLDVALVGANRREVTDLVEGHRSRSSAAAYRSRVGAGTPDQLATRYLELCEAGVSTVFVTMPNLTGPGEVESFGSVIAAFRSARRAEAESAT
jgi:alkanesulfonate monooxygenase SsuD/methylene tetrahydromethanopterin reductase-like flavin-dependent oxidoreductase (luciferase family)